MHETSKLTGYRRTKGYEKYFRGDVIDIGCGPDPIKATDWPTIKSVRGYDMKDGDANFVENVADAAYDCVYASHTLEHMFDPYVTLEHWLRICKPGGHVVVAVPHELWYEKLHWGEKGSQFNGDHKTSWNLEYRTNLPKTVFVPDLLRAFSLVAEVLVCETILRDFDFVNFRKDQTMGRAVCQIEFVLRKK